MKSFFEVFIFSIVIFTGSLGHSITPSHKKSGDDKHYDKKGTIRIAGPWHSDSALDRNVDIAEDAYVKKIISSNEGINLNKDMAEAGEMFDVNGIDDFYDKSALITYEINGHEVPVHMKPKLTPQYKSLFPEYVKDSPAEMGGITRNHKGTSGALHGYVKKVNGLKLPPGLTIYDLPEYKMGRYTGRKPGNEWKSLQGLKEEKEFRNVAKQNKALTKMFANQLPVLSQLTRREKGNRRSKDGAMSDDDKITIESLKHHVPRSNNEYQSFGHEAQEKESSKEAALFRNLNTLHRKLQIDKEENEAELRSIPENQHIGPKKQKAKARILNLLGELTEKLKGMESMISAHRDKKVEKFLGNQEHEYESRADFENDQKDVAPEHRDFTEMPDQQPSTDKIESISKMGDQFKDGVAKLHQGLDEEEMNNQNYAKFNGAEKGNVEENDGNANEILVKSFEKIGTTDVDKPHNVESKETEMVDRFSEENKPIVMDTKAIDYDPADENEREKNEKVNTFEAEEPLSSKTNHQKFIDNDGEGDEHKEEDMPIQHALSRFYKNIKDDNRDNFDNEKDEHDHEDNEHGNARRRHKPRHRHNDDESDENNEESSDIVKHHHRHHHQKYHTDESNLENDFGDEKEESLSGDEGKRFTSNKKNDEDATQNEVDEKESASEVEESLGDADEKGRRRTFKPKANVPTPAQNFNYPDYNEVKDAAIFETNLIRKKYHAKNVHWSDRLSDRAQKTAEKLAGMTDVNEKTLSKFREAGENFAVIDANSPNVGKDAPDLWARKSENFNFISPQITDKNIDFAQLVWKSDNEFGLGVAKSKTGKNWIVTSAFDSPVVNRFKDLRYNVESDIPMSDPYSDITG